jgi:hypothetical protein
LKTIIILFTLLLIFGTAGGQPLIQAQVMSIDSARLNLEDAKTLMELQKKANMKDGIGIPRSPEEAEKWANIGKAVAIAISTTCKELSIEVNKFSETAVGKMTMFLIIWQIIIKDLIGLVAATLLWLVTMAVLIWSYRRHFPERTKNKETGEITYVERKVWNDDGTKAGSMWAHILIFVVVSAVWVISAIAV